jgi:hypothetical protein
MSLILRNAVVCWSKLVCVEPCHWVSGDRLDLLTANCQPIWFDWEWLWLYVLVGLGSYRYCGCDRLGCTASGLCCFVSLVCGREFGAASLVFRLWKMEIRSSNSVHLRPYFGHMTSFSASTSVPTSGATQPSIFIGSLLRPQYQGTVLSSFFGVGVQYFLSRSMEMGQAKFVFPTQCVSNCVLKFWTAWRGKLTWITQGDKKASVHLMITIQEDTSNVQSVSRQSPDIYWHTSLLGSIWLHDSRPTGPTDSH